MQTERGLRLHMSRPWQSWAFGTFIAALLIMFFVAAIREGTPLLVWRAWPAYAVTAMFSPIAILMLSVQGIECRIDPASREIVISRYRLLGWGNAECVGLTAIRSVDVIDIETSDGNAYHVDLIEAGGRRHRVTASQIRSLPRADAIAARMRQGIGAARDAPVLSSRRKMK